MLCDDMAGDGLFHGGDGPEEWMGDMAGDDLFHGVDGLEKWTVDMAGDDLFHGGDGFEKWTDEQTRAISQVSIGQGDCNGAVYLSQKIDSSGTSLLHDCSMHQVEIEGKDEQLRGQLRKEVESSKCLACLA